MRAYAYHRVDVFTDVLFGGNPLAVFSDADGMSNREMQLVAREMNLSETVFCVPSPSADLGLRIFTVDREVPLAGHPTVGAIWILAKLGVLPLRGPTRTVDVEIGVGVLPVEILGDDRREPDRVVMTQRVPSFGEPFDDRARLARALGLDRHQLAPGELPARIVDTGIPWFLIPLADLRALRAVRPDFAECERIAAEIGTDLFHAFTQDTDEPTATAHGRHVWFGHVTPSEDPFTGSACGCVSAYLVTEGVVHAAPTAEILFEQGAEFGRPGTALALVDADETGRVRGVRVGGRGVHVGDGEIRLP